MIEGTACPDWNPGGHLPFVFSKTLQNCHLQILDCAVRGSTVLNQSGADLSSPINAKCTFCPQRGLKQDLFMERTVKEYRKHSPYQYLNPFGEEGSSSPGKAGNVCYVMELL